MLQIPCPWCGPRPDTEFLCTGEARAPLADAPHPGAAEPVEDATETATQAATDSATEPDAQATTDAATWADRLWHRDNPRGLVRERWWHAHGCRLWLTVERDTTTNVIHSARGEPA